MANITDLPEEILIIIIKHLDFKSANNLYETCRRLRDIIVKHGVIKVCHLSFNTLATARSLQLDMVKQISSHLSELNMSAVTDLTKKLLLPAIKKMKCLETLDVSFTNITMLDLLDLYKNCPTIKNVAVNFHFGVPEEQKVSNNALLECQEIFKKFKNVHFIMNHWVSSIAMYVLQKSSINTLKYSICQWNIEHFENYHTMIENIFPFNHICIFVLNLAPTHVYDQLWFSLLSPVSMESIEYIIIEYNKTYSFCTSPMFTKFLSDNYNITNILTFDAKRSMRGNIVILLWDRKTTVFDELFFCNLKLRLNDIFTCDLEVANDQLLTSGINVNIYDQFNIIPIRNSTHELCVGPEIPEPVCKKSRVAPQAFLNYDSIFKEHRNIKLGISFDKYVFNATLAESSEYLSKITYLSLNGYAQYGNGFFNILFRCCINLVTLNVSGFSRFPCCPYIMESIPLSKSIKNIKVVDERIDFNMLFSSFSQCGTLENICIIDDATEFDDLADPTALFQKCNNLYNLYIEATMSKCSTEKNLQMLNAVKKNYSKHHLNMTLYNPSINLCRDYNPYLSVFQINPIRPFFNTFGSYSL